MKYTYGNHAADPNKIYVIGDKGKLRRIDIFNFFWDEWKSADTIFIDFPYDNRMIKHYYEQVDQTTDKNFADLCNRAFEIILAVFPKYIFIEIGKKNAAVVEDYLHRAGYSVKVYNSFYYKTNPCYIIAGVKQGDPFLDVDIEGLDELDAIANICAHDSVHCICDFFNGQGATSRSAYKAGKNFVCSELNERRLGKAIYDLEKLGAKIVEQEIEK